MSIDIEQYIDQQRWLLNNGLVSEMTKNNLYVYGSIVHRDVKALEVQIDAAAKKVHYVIFLPTSIIKIHNKYQALKGSAGLWDLWHLRGLLRKHGNLDMGSILNTFVKDYCGPMWNATIEIRNESEYREDEPKTDADSD